MMNVHSKTDCVPNYDSYPSGAQTCALEFASFVANHYRVWFEALAVDTSEYGSTSVWKLLNAQTQRGTYIHHELRRGHENTEYFVRNEVTWDKLFIFVTTSVSPKLYHKILRTAGGKCSLQFGNRVE